MSASVLTKIEQRKTLSAMKNKKKKAQKNILTTPDDITVRTIKLESQEVSELQDILRRLLCQARLHDTKGEKNKEAPAADISLNRNKRSQLLPGINAVSKAVRKGTVECILFANDIKPKILISHLQVLCSIKKIPYLFMPNFRDLTNKTLGFPCIVLGFKIKSKDFLPAIMKIKSIAHPVSSSNDRQENIAEDETAVLQHSNDSKNEVDLPLIQPVTKFTYLYRNDNVTRAYIPENLINKNKLSNVEFMSLNCNSDEEEKDSNSLEKKEKSKETKIHEKINMNNRQSKAIVSNNTLSQNNITKGKNSKRKNSPITYSAPKIIKLESNPHRAKKKFKKLKKLKPECQ